eukprot:1572938-Amphidinium_carterae.1
MSMPGGGRRVESRYPYEGMSDCQAQRFVFLAMDGRPEGFCRADDDSTLERMEALQDVDQADNLIADTETQPIGVDCEEDALLPTLGSLADLRFDTLYRHLLVTLGDELANESDVFPPNQLDGSVEARSGFSDQFSVQINVLLLACVCELALALDIF